MPRLPDTSAKRPVPGDQRAVATLSRSAVAAPGNALQGIGETITNFGDVVFDRATTAEATERDNYLSDQIRDLIYNPETGFLAQQGKGAVNARENTIQKLEALKQNAFKDLNGTARRKLEGSADRRIASALDAVERHTLGQREVWLAGASQARMTAAYQDAIASPDLTASALSAVESETRAQGIREGWGPEKTRVEVEAARSKVYVEQIARIAASNPTAAMEYLRKNQNDMVASDVANLEAKLTPEVKKALGRAKGRELYQGSGVPASAGGLQALVDKTEGGAAYDTLYNFSQRDRFSGVDVSKMTIGQLKEFSKPGGDYANWVKADVGHVATPMGRYQIVGKTLATAAQQMGLSDDTVFDAATQDAMFAHLARQRLDGPRTPEGKRAALRAEWEGFKHVSDSELDAAIVAFEKGGSAPAPVSANFDFKKYAIQGATRPDSFTGMVPEMRQGLASMLTAADAELGEGLQVYSGYRSDELQATLFKNAVKKYGSEAAARKWVAPPGRSRHNTGKAADLKWQGKRIDQAPAHVRDWIKQNANRFGLDVPMEWEPWQVELNGDRGQPVAAQQAAPDYNRAMREALKISDPVERQHAIAEIELRDSIRQGEVKASLESAKNLAFQAIEAGTSVDDIPVDYRQALGMEAMSALRTYQNKLAKNEPVETDPAVYYELRKMPPEEFKDLNLLEYIDVLSPAHMKQMMDAQTKPVSEQRASGFAASTLMTTADRHMQAAGIEDDPATEAEIQSRLLQWQDQYITENGAAPTYQEIDDRIRRELLPVVIDPRGTLDPRRAFDKRTGTMADTDDWNYKLGDLESAEIFIGGTEFKNEEVRGAIEYLIDLGEDVTAENVVTVLLESHELTKGRLP